MTINIQTLFADIIDTPEQRQQKLLQQGMLQGQLLSSGLRGRAAALAPLAQMAGQLGVQRQEDLRRAVQPMLGIDPRTTGEKMAEQLNRLDPNDPNSLLEAAKSLQSIDPVRAASLRQAAAQLEAERAAARQKTAETQRIATERIGQREAMSKFIQESNLSATEQASYIEAANSGAFDGDLNGLIERLSPNSENRFKVVGNNIWDSEEKKFIVPPSQQADEGLDLSPKDYDPASIIRFENAMRNAASPEEREAVSSDPATMPLPVADNGWSWQKAKDGDKVVYVARPTSQEALQTVKRDITKANEQASKTKQELQNTFVSIKDIKNAVEEKDVNTVLGKVTKNIPGTDAYQIDAEINTLLSNLGFNALNSARAASANGASGFGQLTEREMEILQSLIAPLKFGLKKEEFISQLDRIESFLTESQSRLKNNWDVDSWIGLPSSKPKDTTELSDDELMAKYGEV
jgi:hypothetical protein